MKDTLLIALGITIFIWLLYWLLTRRSYKIIDGKLYVKEGFFKWETLEEHMKKEHNR